MKPTSIIFLCLSVLLIVGGIVTCYIASGMAEKENIDLFENYSDAEGNNVVPRIIDDLTLNKVSLVLKDVDVNIYGGSDRSYIELVNFSVNSYSYAVSNSILTIDESIGFLSLINFSESSVSFNGLRHYLKWNLDSNKQRIVNIYLTDKYTLKQLEIKLNNGNITASGLSNKTDYSFNIKKGNLIYMDSRNKASVSVKISEGDVTLENVDITTLTAEIEKGDFSYYSINYSYQSYSIITADGTVYLAGAKQGNALSSSTPMASNAISAKITKGDVYIDKPAKSSNNSNNSDDTSNDSASSDTAA